MPIIMLAATQGCGDGGSGGNAPSVAPTSTGAGPVGALDEPGRFACDDFAEGYKSATTKGARGDLANKVAEWGPKSQTPRIAEMSAALGRGADATEGAWKIAADGFAQACLDAGWTAR